MLSLFLASASSVFSVFPSSLNFSPFQLRRPPRPHDVTLFDPQFPGRRDPGPRQGEHITQLVNFADALQPEAGIMLNDSQWPERFSELDPSLADKAPSISRET